MELAEYNMTCMKIHLRFAIAIASLPSFCAQGHETHIDTMRYDQIQSGILRASLSDIRQGGILGA